MSEFDDLFKSRLEGHEVDVPQDMWSRIQSAQEPQNVNRKKGVAWKLASSLVVFLIILCGILFHSYDPQNQTISSTEKVIDCEPSSFADHIKTSNNASNDILIAKSDSELAAILIKNFDGIEKKEFANTSKSKNQVKPIKFFFEKKNSVSENLNSQSDRIDKEKLFGEEKVKNKESIDHTSILNTIPTYKFPSRLTVDFNFMPEYDKKCPSFGKSLHGYFSVETYVSSDYNLKTLVTDNEEFKPYADLRSSTERGLYSYSYGVRFKWHNNSGLGLGIGLDRSIVNEKFTFVENDAREVKVIISIDTLFNMDGSFTTSTDTTRVEIQGTRTNIINNSYTSLDLPLHLSYQMEFRRWAIALSGGIYVNLMFDQKGRILNFQGEPAWINNDEKNELDIYRASSGVKFDGAITLVYHLNNYLDILAEPYFRYNPNSLTRENSPVQHFNNTMGIRTGIRYNFGF